LTISPDGRYIYAAAPSDNAISWFSINQGSVALKQQMMQKHRQVFMGYPNPFNSQINIRSPRNLQSLVIYSVKGRVITRVRDIGKFKWDIQGLAQGVYVIRAKTDKGVVTTKIVKK
jgi:hypothetical protein